VVHVDHFFDADLGERAERFDERLRRSKYPSSPLHAAPTTPVVSRPGTSSAASAGETIRDRTPSPF
jgi:hypothetical protein